MTEPPSARHYWIFWKSEDFFDEEAGPQPGEEIVLSVGSHLKDIHPGDVAYFGIAGQVDVIGAWGFLTSELTVQEQAAAKKTSKSGGRRRRYSVRMTYQEVIEPPITLGEITGGLAPLWVSEEEDNLEWVPEEQAAALNKLIRSREGIKGPPDPGEEVWGEGRTKNLDELFEALDRELDPEREPSAADTREGSESSPDGANLSEVLGKYTLSALSRAILGRAGEFARKRRRYPNLITTSCLLFAAAETGREAISMGTAARFLFESLSGHSEGQYEHEFTEFMSTAADSASRKAGEVAEPGGDDPRIPASVLRIIETARSISDFVRKEAAATRGVICGRDLIAALLFDASTTGRDKGAAGRFEHMGVSLEALRVDYVKSFLSNSVNVEDNVERWGELLIELKPASEWGARKAARKVKPSLPRIDSDTPSVKADLLGITPEVEGFAKIIAARDVKTPLSIGLFGDWGSGKSTFMEQLQAKVEEIGRMVRERDGDEPTAFLGNIVQIKFNAWHYVESNLWASLVSHVFENLSFSEEEEREKAEERKRLLLTKLDTTLAAQKVAEAEVKAKQEKLESAESALDAAKREQSKARLRRRDVLRHGVWPFVREVLARDPEAQGHIDRARELLGREGLSEEELKREIEATRTTVGRAQMQFALMLKDPPRALWVVLFLLALILLPPLLTLALNGWGLGEALNRYLVSVTPILTLIGGALAWLGSKRAQFNQLLDKLQKAGEQIDRMYEAARSRYDAEVSRLETEVKARETQVSEATKQLLAARQEVDKTVSDLKEMEPGRMLERFVQERAASTDYRKLLGVVALIRRDFKRLSDLLSEQGNEELKEAVKEIIRKHNAPHDVPTAAGDGGGSQPAEPSKGEVEEKLKEYRIDRIVLYIDDLDRCPPKQVVDVLQAIHLLLAFELFVVVVGVDARWVRHALRKRYPDLLGEDQDESDADADKEHHLVRTATPRDYMEKIFQVPFWLRPMSRDASEKLLKGLIPDGDNLRRESRGGDGRKAAGEPASTNGGVSGGNGRPPVSSTPHTEPGVPEQQGAKAAAPNEGGSAATDSPASEPEAKGAKSEAKRRGFSLKPDDLVLEDRERATMIALSRVIGRTPRTMKRFVNVYRIIKAGLGGDDMDALLGAGGAGGQYSALLLLLGVAHGVPDVAPAFFRRLKETFESGRPGDIGLRAFLDKMSRPEYAPSDSLREGWNFVIRELKKFADSREEDMPLAVLRRWSPVVVRYTFQLGRMSEEIE